MAHKNKKSNRPQVRNADSAKSKIKQKDKKRQTSIEIIGTKIEEKVNLANWNRIALDSYKLEKSSNQKTFKDTIGALELKHKTLDINYKMCFETSEKVKNCQRIYMEHLQTLFQLHIFQMVARLEQAEIFEESGKLEGAYELYNLQLDTMAFKSKVPYEGLKENEKDFYFQEMIKLQLIALYGMIRTGIPSKYETYESARDKLSDCLTWFKFKPLLQNDKMELFHRTVHFSDLRLKIVDAKRKIENAMAIKLFRFEENSKMISALARKAFS